MPPFDFPSPPTVGQIVIGPNNTQYQWDGTKWVTVVNAAAGGGVTISDTAPINPIIGRLWFDSVGLQTYIWYTDPTSSQWTPVINQSGLLTDAPSDGNYYSRHNGTWSSVAGAFLPLTGGTLTGPLTINTTGGAPTSGLTINGWQTYVDSNNVFTIASASTTQATLANTGNFAVQGSITANRGAVYASSVNNSTRGFLIQTLGSTRWYIYAEGSGETGSNAGSNFQIAGYTDAGAAIANYFSINRATGSATFSNAGGNNIYINAPVGTQRGIFGQTSGVNRWLLQLGNTAAETGGNVGSDFALVSIPDSGNGAIAVPLSITRSNGNAYFSANIYMGNQLFCQGNQPTIYLNKSASGDQAWIFGETNGSSRWINYVGDGAAETGGNAGSAYYVVACTDAGSYNLQAIGIQRTDGIVHFPYGIVNGSDSRQKRDFTQINDGLARIKQLSGVSYERIARPGRRELGLVAQDVLAVIPEAVETILEPADAPQDKRIGTDDEPFLGINYTQITALLIEAVKTLAAKVEALEAARGL